VLVLAACFAGQTAQASVLIVGTCKAGIQFATIGAAVTSAPNTGATIDVCPGTYPEQVTISNKSLTLKGISSGNNGAAIITSPNGGLQQNATRFNSQPVEAQIFVQNGAVTISDLTTDAANNNLDNQGCNGNPVGIFYQNASGTITRNSVLNDVLATNTGCQSGLGIYAENSTSGGTLTITYNSVERFQKNGITVHGPGTGSGVTGSIATISYNTVTGQGPWGGAAQNAIEVAFGASGTVSYNTVGSDVWAPDVFGDTGDAAAGILVYASEGVTISNNSVNQTQYGIVSVTDPAYGSVGDYTTVTKNTVATTYLYDGIDLCSSNNIVTSNTINGSDEAAIHLDATCTGSSTGNSVSRNVINSACAGVLSGSASGNSIGTNTYYNAINLVLTGTDTCTPAPVAQAKRAGAKSHGQFKPLKP
jgi:hypothetical protein